MDLNTKKCLFRWQDYSSTVTIAVQTLRFDEELLDVTLACEGNTIRAHKLVLAASSLYFRQILREHPCDHPTIVIDGIEWKELLSILHFMYNGQVLVEEDAVSSLLAAAASLAVIGLSYVSAALVHSKVNRQQQCISPAIISDAICSTSEEVFDNNKLTEINNSNLQNCSSNKNNDLLLQISKPKKIKVVPQNLNLNLIDAIKVDVEAEPPEKKQKHCFNNKLENCTKVFRQNDTNIIGSKIINKEESLLLNGPLKNDMSYTKGNCDKNNDIGKLKIIKNEENNSDISIPKNLKNFCSNKITNNAVANGTDPTAKCLNDNEDSLDAEENQDASPENCYMDLGPDPLPLNHPAVLAAASSSAIAEAGSDNFLSDSVDSISHINAISYAAFLAATGILPSGIGNGSITGSSSTSFSCFPSINEINNSPSSPIYGLNAAQLKGMSQQELQATLEQYQRKLAFHEPRPCPTCSRMYRDAATLRTHIAIMHSEGKEPFLCTCGSIFKTKYDMYQHRKNGHR